MERKYTAKFFKKSMPDWKKKKDPFIHQIIFRPLSFHLSAFCANRGISANTVSYLSIIPAALTVICFFTKAHWAYILGGVLLNLWCFLDCVDGNIARSVRKQPFGAFADACSSYLLIALIYVGIGYACYCDGGFLFEKGNSFILVLTGIATGLDSFMRFVYYKYKETVKGLGLDEVMEKEEHTPNIKERLGEATGIGGYQPLFILLASIFYFLDVVVLFVLLLHSVMCIYIVTTSIRNAIRITREIESND